MKVVHPQVGKISPLARQLQAFGAHCAGAAGRRGGPAGMQLRVTTDGHRFRLQFQISNGTSGTEEDRRHELKQQIS